MNWETERTLAPRLSILALKYYSYHIEKMYDIAFPHYTLRENAFYNKHVRSNDLAFMRVRDREQYLPSGFKKARNEGFHKRFNIVCRSNNNKLKYY